MITFGRGRPEYEIWVTLKTRDKEMIGEAGMMILKEHGEDYAQIKGLNVLPEYRRMGFGEEICRYLIDIAKTLGMPTVCAYPVTEASERLCKKLGIDTPWKYWKGLLCKEL